jgi:hypothetical protein
MGALFNGQCFGTNSEAADAFFTSQGPSYTAGATSYQSWYEKSTVWQIKRQSIASNGAITNLATSNATVPAFPDCDVNANFNDGMLLGWGIASAMVAAFAVKFLSRALNR